MKKLLAFTAVGLVGVCFWFAVLQPTRAAGGSDVWQVGPNCVGVTSTSQHICRLVLTNHYFPPDQTAFNQWNVIVVEPGTVTHVTCQTFGTNIFLFTGAFDGHKPNPWEGEHYGNVGICRGWINGGNGPVKITATYR